MGDNMRHKNVSLKVSFSTWHLFRNLLSTKDNLLRHSIIQANFVLCVGGCGMEESADHLFLRCNFFGSMWYFIRDWLRLSSVDPGTLADHFVQFIQSRGFQGSLWPFMLLIWLSCGWIILKEINNRIFNNK